MKIFILALLVATPAFSAEAEKVVKEPKETPEIRIQLDLGGGTGGIDQKARVVGGGEGGVGG